MLKKWNEHKKEEKEEELLEEIKKKIESKEFAKYESELQNCFVKAKEKLSKEIKEREK
ncbi:hypothetical protein [endosymbiont GvMRE of Glomus versiforme]|uniref:hypothetical protein n=1 Tax=endosymbiont GvMRE of Glomus versiforme TaxID=2039283 RepID=UPI001559D85F|nr:hypothetical protein [endosymbiont GvMRE of Glomus versiforme]